LKKTYIVGGLLLMAIAGCSSEQVDTEIERGANKQVDLEQGEQMNTKDGEVVFNLKVEETQWMFDDETTTEAWTYNGTIPGEEIRVQEGDKVIVNVKNDLEVPTSLHLHGFPVPNEMDGVPGVTQNAIMPGEEFTYEYQTDVPGTYWYHSHQDGATQVDKGLYGVFIVEPEGEDVFDVDEAIVIDEFSSMDMGEMNHGDMDGMEHGEMTMSNENMDGMSHTEMMNQMYDTMVINGQAPTQVETIEAKEGDKAKLRIVNTGLFTQVVSIPEHSFKVTHYDGQDVNQPSEISETKFRIAPAERYDIEIDLDNPGAWGIQVYAEKNQERLNTLIPLVYDGNEGQDLQTGDSSSSFLDITTYGEGKDIDLGDVTKEFDMLLGTDDGGDTFTINSKQFPDHEIYEVDEGDVVKVTIENDTDVVHPMHLHGEFFNVISKNGEPIQGSPVLKDTLNVRPDETYEIVFEASNPGNWMFHCHEFHHAEGGMIAEVQYTEFEPSFTPDPDILNKPE